MPATHEIRCPTHIVVLLTLLAWLLPAPVMGADDFRDHSRLPLEQRLQFLEDPSGDLGLDAVRARDDWQQLQGHTFNRGYSDSAWWLRVRLSNEADTGVERLFSIGYPVLGDVQVHVLADGERHQSWQLGHDYPYSQRPLDHRFFVVPLEWEANETLTVYLRVRTESSVQVPVTLWDREAFRSRDITANILHGIYFGAFLVIGVYNLLLFFALGERNYLYYVGFVFSIALLMASLTGYGFRYLWPAATEWNDQAILVFICSVLIFAGLFMRRFLQLSQLSVRLDALALLVVAISSVSALLSFWLSYFALILVLIPLVVLGCLIAFSGGLYAWYRGQATAKYYVMAWSFLLVGGIVLALSKGGVLPSNVVTDHAAQIGSIFEVVLLSFALAQRINVERQLRYEAQSETLETARRLNRELEDRVRERTRELEALNRKLNELSVTDELTGLRNRRFLDEQLRQEVEWARRTGRPIAVAMLDIDHFKPVNDTYGHQVGDECLKMVGAIVQANLRSPQDTAARYGGEEFAMILPETDEPGAVSVIERIRQQVSEVSLTNEGVNLTMTLSGGVTIQREAASVTPEQLLADADKALYRAKAEGRDRVCVDHSEDG
ncbi:diguanylate cyclase [Halomonadaceae bacterium KBTZ08]